MPITICLLRVALNVSDEYFLRELETKVTAITREENVCALIHPVRQLDTLFIFIIGRLRMPMAMSSQIYMAVIRVHV
uniref:Uncharacterized protein n=1 Tax=Trichogramma kaykai TaxID=54128 RepID=A0ABD2WV03_9HYME